MKVLLNEGFLTYSVSEAGNPGNEQGPGTGQNDNDARTHTEPYWKDRVYYYIVVRKFDFIHFLINVDHFHTDFDALFYIHVGFKISNQQRTS